MVMENAVNMPEKFKYGEDFDLFFRQFCTRSHSELLRASNFVWALVMRNSVQNSQVKTLNHFRRLYHLRQMWTRLLELSILLFKTEKLFHNLNKKRRHRQKQKLQPTRAWSVMK